MPKELVKLDETLDAKPCEPPKPRRNRLGIAACVAAALLLVVAAAVLAVRYSRARKRPSFDQLLPWSEMSVTISPADWSKEVNGLRCKLVVIREPDGAVSASLRVVNTGAQVIIMGSGDWRLRADGPAALQSCKPIGQRPPMADPVVVLPGEECEVKSFRGLNDYAYVYGLCEGKCAVWAAYRLPEGLASSHFDAKGLPKGMPADQIEKLENELKKSPGSSRVSIWYGQIETPRVHLTVKRLQPAQPAGEPPK